MGNWRSVRELHALYCSLHIPRVPTNAGGGAGMKARAL